MDRPLFMPDRLGLQAEYYQLVLAATYHADGFWGDATFDLYARSLPEGCGYLVAAGLGPLLDHLEALRFTETEVRRLRDDPVFAHVSEAFFESLLRLRFAGEVHAVPEGTVVFPGEPILRITAPLIVNTLIETRVIQLVAASTAIATRAARMVDAAEGRPVIDFGSRRAPGPEAALLAARAAYLGGVAATTNALAVYSLGIPSFGTMSDTFLAAYGDDRLAWDAYRLHFPDLAHVALPDDDPLDGIARFLPFRDEVRTVRVDHGNLDYMSRQVRARLDALGMKQARILGSGHLDERSIRALVTRRAPVQLFGVGRALSSVLDHEMRMAFRIAERSSGVVNIPVRHAGGAAWPGKKQVMRYPGGDVVCLESEVWEAERTGGRPLLHRVVAGGQRLAPLPGLAAARALRAREVAALPPAVRDLDRPAAWPVTTSAGVAALATGGR